MPAGAADRSALQTVLNPSRRAAKSGPGEPVRDTELEGSDDAAPTDDARQLGECGSGIVDVAEEVRHRKVVELGVGERESFRARLHQLDGFPEPSAGRREHLRALVDACHPEPAADEGGTVAYRLRGRATSRTSPPPSERVRAGSTRAAPQEPSL